MAATKAVPATAMLLSKPSSEASTIEHDFKCTRTIWACRVTPRLPAPLSQLPPPQRIKLCHKIIEKFLTQRRSEQSRNRIPHSTSPRRTKARTLAKSAPLQGGGQHDIILVWPGTTFPANSQPDLGYGAAPYDGI